jgi:hypothetical protein
MRIAFAVIDEIPDGGAVAHRVQMLAGGLASLGHEVHIIAPYKFSPGPLAQESNGEKPVLCRRGQVQEKVLDV